MRSMLHEPFVTTRPPYNATVAKSAEPPHCPVPRLPDRQLAAPAWHCPVPRLWGGPGHSSGCRHSKWHFQIDDHLCGTAVVEMGSRVTHRMATQCWQHPIQIPLKLLISNSGVYCHSPPGSLQPPPPPTHTHTHFDALIASLTYSGCY